VKGQLVRNKIGRWQVDDVELTSGDHLEIYVDGVPLRGVIEYWQNDYHWFSLIDGIPVLPLSGMKAKYLNNRRMT